MGAAIPRAARPTLVERLADLGLHEGDDRRPLLVRRHGRSEARERICHQANSLPSPIPAFDAKRPKRARFSVPWAIEIVFNLLDRSSDQIGRRRGEEEVDIGDPRQKIAPWTGKGDTQRIGIDRLHAELLQSAFDFRGGGARL